jgi:hypothetical protein
MAVIEMFFLNGLKKEYSLSGDGQSPNDSFLAEYNRLGGRGWVRRKGQDATLRAVLGRKRQEGQSTDDKEPEPTRDQQMVFPIELRHEQCCPGQN